MAGFLFGLITMIIVIPIFTIDKLARHGRLAIPPFLPHRGERQELAALGVGTLFGAVAIGFILSTVLS